jgi:two-component system sensor kinase FixL
MDRPRTGHAPSRVAAATLIAAAIFAIDTFTPLESAVAVLYVLVLVIADGGLPSRHIRTLSAFCTALTAASFGINHGVGAGLAPTMRLVFSLAAIAVTSVLIERNRASRAAAENVVRRSEERYRTIFETLAVAIIEHDLRAVRRALYDVTSSGGTDLAAYMAAHPEFVEAARPMVRITDVNGTAIRLLRVSGKHDFISSFADFLPESDDTFARFLVALGEDRPSFEAETRMRAADGELVDVIVAITFPSNREDLRCVRGVLLDMTELRRVQVALERTRSERDHAMRAATIGELSATIAHEVNQPLSAVRTYADAARRWLSREPPVLDEARAAMEEVVESAAHAGEVVTRVQRLLGKAAPERVPLSLDTVVREVLDLMRGQLSDSGTALTVHLRSGPVPVSGDRILLQQLVTNLVTNALQAMEPLQHQAKRLTIRTTDEGDRVRLAVLDSGPGFPPDVARRGFEPFFTTKPSGMGLGLAMARSIVEAHDGDIALSNAEHSTGAVVTVDLPTVRSGSAE